MAVSRAQLAELTGYDVDMPIAGYVGIRDNRMFGWGGLAWGGGRCWLFLSVLEEPSAIVVWRWAKRMLVKAVQLGETEIYTPRDRQHETSERLLSRLGFTFHGMEQGEEIWLWHHSQSSQA
ncbi:hypothetical protein [Pelagibacterium luteolum]|uniref:N-acetyltransferase domain-containing protein n=1 Tax=Pelagibacterium luteolum TaxID=440168 RepID=A0A1G7ZIU3_9HYPH|nr:hypothetical protein [Pelagibacterium luteolum]SDH08497.1 hypothetical protein SAMN04487974_12038 [Pelagibacterium luteolum]